jgi:hypothetical protein
MTPTVKLLKQKFAIEQKIYQLKHAEISEEKQDAAQKLLVKFNEALNDINKKINITEDDGHIDPRTYTQEPDHEVQMARGDLYRAAKHAIMLHEILQRLDEKQGLEGWVQAKITKAADYIETVWHYLAYEMRFPSDEQGYNHNEGMREATYGPGEDPNQPQMPQAPGAPQQNSNQAKTGQQSATPTTGGSTPSGATPGMVKMAKLGPDKKPQGTPIMVRSTDIAGKQKAGYFVIGESKEEKKVVHCSQCGKGFSAAGVDAKYKTGFSHCKDHKGKKVIEENASAGASSSGGIASSMGNGTGFASGGIGMQRRKKKKFESEDPMDKDARDSYGRRAPAVKKLKDGTYHAVNDAGEHKIFKDEAAAKRHAHKTDEGTMTDIEKEGQGPKFTGYWKGKDKGRPGKKMVGGD